MSPYKKYRFTINELTIDDNMFSYGTRSTKFINLEHKMDGVTIDKMWLGPNDGKDRLFDIVFDVSPSSKVITRTRRKFWEDVSLRGG